MAKSKIILIQKPDSPFRELAGQVLGDKCVFRLRQAPARPLAHDPPPMVLWDTSGFDRQELERTAGLLAPEGLGVLLLCPELDRDCRLALERCRALGLAYRPPGPAALAALWHLARDLHRRLLELRNQYHGLQKELATKRLVDRAKLIIMRAGGCSEGQALRRLQTYSRRHNRRLVEVAQGIIAGFEVFDDRSEE